MSSQSFNFGTAMGNMMMKQLCWACTAGGAHKNVILLFQRFFIFLETRDCDNVSPKLTNLSLPSTALHDQCDDSKLAWNAEIT